MTDRRPLTWAGRIPRALTLASFALAVLVARALASGEASSALAELTAVAMLLLAGAFTWALARAYERRRAAGAVHLRQAAVGDLLLGLGVLGFTVAGATTPLAGIALVVAVAVAGFVMASRHTTRRRQRPIGDRRDLARERGWRYDASDTGLQIWWGARAGGAAGGTIRPFGIVTGEVHRLPFTGFDTATPDGRITTHWVVDLPEAFPPIAVCEPGAEGVTAADPAFAAALATPGVIEETAAHDLWGWRIDGRDLILSRPYTAAPCPAAELAAVAEGLAALYYRFPLDAVRRFGGTVDAPTPLPRRLPN